MRPGLRRARLAAALSLATLLASAGPALAHDSGFGLARYTPQGSLDPTFGDGGLIVRRSIDRSFVANGLTVQPDGAILITGMVGDLTSSTLRVAIERYTPDGHLDPAFGTAGTATMQLGAAGAESRVVVVQPDGKILVTGTVFAAASSEDEFLVARLWPDGSPDVSFGTAGATVLPVGEGGAQATALALEPDGRIVVAGSAFANPTTDDDFAVVRLDADGTPDRAFGSDGVRTIDFGAPGPGATASIDRGAAVALQPDGKVVVAGTARGEHTAFAVARLEPDGAFDTTFGLEGRLTLPAGPDAQVHALVVQHDGALVVAGGGPSSDGSAPFSLIRLRPDGVPDASFGNAGVVTTTFLGSRSGARAVAAAADGTLIAGGAKYGAPSAAGDVWSDSGFAVARYHVDGSIDLGFGTGGRVVTSLGDAGATPLALAVQSDGRIVAAGLVFFRVPSPDPPLPLGLLAMGVGGVAALIGVVVLRLKRSGATRA